MLVSLSSFFSAILNSHNRFAETAAAPIILNIVLIIILLFSKYLNDNLVYYLSFGVTLAGIFTVNFFLYFFVKKYFDFKFDYNFKLSKKVEYHF